MRDTIGMASDASWDLHEQFSCSAKNSSWNEDRQHTARDHGREGGGAERTRAYIGLWNDVFKKKFHMVFEWNFSVAKSINKLDFCFRNYLDNGHAFLWEIRKNAFIADIHSTSYDWHLMIYCWELQIKIHFQLFLHSVMDSGWWKLFSSLHSVWSGSHKFDKTTNRSSNASFDWELIEWRRTDDHKYIVIETVIVRVWNFSHSNWQLTSNHN